MNDRRPGRAAGAGRRRRHVRRARARPAAPGDPRGLVRADPGAAVLRPAGARRGVVTARGRWRRAAGDGPARAGGGARTRGRGRRMSRTARLVVFAVSATGLAALLAWSFAGLPDFGVYTGRYGRILAQIAEPDRGVTNAVTFTAFDVRAVDTLIEEFIVFAAA